MVEDTEPFPEHPYLQISTGRQAVLLEAARVTVAGQLRRLADEIEALPLDDAAEALSWLGDHIERLLREADRILRARRSGQRS